MNVKRLSLFFVSPWSNSIANDVLVSCDVSWPEKNFHSAFPIAKAYFNGPKRKSPRVISLQGTTVYLTPLGSTFFLLLLHQSLSHITGQRHISVTRDNTKIGKALNVYLFLKLVGGKSRSRCLVAARQSWLLSTIMLGWPDEQQRSSSASTTGVSDYPRDHRRRRRRKD